MHFWSKWTMQGNFKLLHFKKFSMVSCGPNWVFFCLFNQGFEHLKLLHKCNSQSGSAFKNHWAPYLHPPSFVKMCFTPEHIFLTHGPLHSTFSHELDVKLATYNFNMCTRIIVQYQWKWIKTCEILIMFNEKPNITQIWKIITHNIMTPWQNFILLNQKSKTHHFW
jgi:hypothetical protein